MIAKIFYYTFALFLISSLLIWVEYGFFANIFLFVGSLAFTVAGFLSREVMRTSFIPTIIIGAILTIGIGIAFSIALDRWTRQEGDKIVAAIEAFYADEQRVPVALSELQPKYLTNIPRCKNRLSTPPFEYVRLNRFNFELIYRDATGITDYTKSGSSRPWKSRPFF